MHMQPSHTARPSGIDISMTWSEVAAFSSAVDANLDRWLADTYRVGITEFRALAFLTRAPDKELRVNDLAQRVGLNQSSATRLVSRLEAKGYARRDVCQDDGRGVYAVITEQGEALVGSARSPYEARISELLTAASVHFPNIDANQLGRSLRQIEALITS